jgi:small GTP-binding protein
MGKAKIDLKELPKDLTVFQRVSLDLKNGTIDLKLTAKNFGTEENNDSEIKRRKFSTILINKKYKVCLMGNSKAGKTCILNQYISSQYWDDYDETIIDFKKKIIKVESQLIEFEIIDTSGNKNYEKILQTQIEESDGYIIVYEKNKSSTIKDYFEMINKNKPFIIVCSKCDNSVSVIDKEMLSLYTDYGASVQKCSAYTEENINLVFEKIFDLILKKNSIKGEFKKVDNIFSLFDSNTSDDFELKMDSS